jgi:hypothetical protein
MNIKIKGFNVINKKQINVNLFVQGYENSIMISLKINNLEISVENEFYFNTFQDLRKELIKQKIDLKCYGSLINVYPSPMMMNSTKAYFLEKGKQAKMNTIVDIFDPVEMEESVSPEVQELFYLNWLKSL